MLVAVGIVDQPVERVESIAQFQFQALGRKISHHRFFLGRIEDPSAGLDREFLARSVIHLAEHLGDRPDNPKAAQVVADRDGNRQLHRGVMLDVFVIGLRDIAGRRLQVKNRVQHELELRTARSQHPVETDINVGERRLGLGLHHPDRHEQTAGQRD